VVDFINEVEEELRKDDYNRLLKKYGPLIGAVLAAIILTAAFLEYREYADNKVAQKAAAVYTAADNAAGEGDLDSAVQQFVALADTAEPGYAGLSLMRAAAIRLDAGDTGQAVAYFDQAAAKFEKPRHKQLAQLKAAYVLAGQGAYSDVVSRMDTLTETEAPYEFLARELLGFAAAQSGNDSLAREQFAYLTSIPGGPAAIKGRAEQSMGLMQVGQALAAPEPIEETPSPSDKTPNDQTTDQSDDE